MSFFGCGEWKKLGTLLRGFACEGCYEQCEDLLDDLQDEEIEPQVILMDIGLPGISGIEGVRQVKKMAPEVKILMQTIYEDDANVFAAICAGADGYLLKNSSPIQILQAIEQVIAGGVPMTPTIAAKIHSITFSVTQYIGHSFL